VVSVTLITRKNCYLNKIDFLFKIKTFIILINNIVKMTDFEIKMHNGSEISPELMKIIEDDINEKTSPIDLTKVYCYENEYSKSHYDIITPSLRKFTFNIVFIFTLIFLIYNIIAYCYIKNLNSEECGYKKFYNDNNSLVNHINFIYIFTIIYSSIIIILSIILLIFALNMKYLINNMVAETPVSILVTFSMVSFIYMSVQTFWLIKFTFILFGTSLYGEDNSCFIKTRALWNWGLATFILQILFNIVNWFRIVNFWR